MKTPAHIFRIACASLFATAFLASCGDLDPVGIRVLVNGTEVSNGDSFAFDTLLVIPTATELLTETATITVVNSGTASLIVDKITISPDTAIEFSSLDSADVIATIDPMSEQAFTLTFTPNSEKNYACALTISNNTKKNASYVVNFIGKGVGMDVPKDSLKADVIDGVDGPQVVLTWEDPLYEGLKNIQVFMDDSSTALAILTVGEQTLTTQETGGLPSGPHVFTVKSIMSSAEGDVFSGGKSITVDIPSTATTMEKVMILSSEIADKAVTLYWVPPTYSCDSIVIEWTPADGNVAVSPSLSNKEITGLTNGTEYNFSIYATSGTQVSEYSYFRETPKDSVPPGAVTALVASIETAAFPVGTKHKIIRLQWTDPTDADLASIIVVCGTAIQTELPGVGTTAFASLGASTTATYTAHAIDTSGNESPTTSVSIYIPGLIILN